MVRFFMLKSGQNCCEIMGGGSRFFVCRQLTQCLKFFVIFILVASLLNFKNSLHITQVLYQQMIFRFDRKRPFNPNIQRVNKFITQNCHSFLEISGQGQSIHLTIFRVNIGCLGHRRIALGVRFVDQDQELMYKQH